MKSKAILINILPEDKKFLQHDAINKDTNLSTLIKTIIKTYINKSRNGDENAGTYNR